MTEPTPVNTFDLRLDNSETEFSIQSLPNLENKIMVASDTSNVFFINSLGSKRKIGILDDFGQLLSANLKKGNLFSGVDPTTNDDSSLDFAHGSLWCNIVTKNYFVCVDPSPGAAVWYKITGIPSGITASDVDIANIGASTDTTTQQYINITQGPGWYDGGAITHNGDGTIDVAVARILVKLDTAFDATTGFIDTPLTTGLVLNDQRLNYIYYDYPSGQIEARIFPTLNKDNVLLNYAWRDGLETVSVDPADDSASLNQKLGLEGADQATGYDGGSARWLNGGRIIMTNLTFFLSTGVIYFGISRKALSSKNNFTYWYRDGVGGWTSVPSNFVVDNQKYDDGSGTLATVPQFKHGLHWVFMDYAGSKAHVLYGTGEYTKSEAAGQIIPLDKPPVIDEFCTLVGTIRTQSGTLETHVEQSYRPFLTYPTAPEHDAGQLLNEGDFQHITQEEKDNFIGDPLTKEPTGFSSPENVIVDYDFAARTITLTGTVDAYWRGQKVDSISSGFVSDSHPAGPLTNQYLYYNGSIALWSGTEPEKDQLQIATVLVDGTGSEADFKNFGMVQTHGFMPWQTQKALSDTVGTYRLSGGEISGIVLSDLNPSNRRPQVASSVVVSEDLENTITQHITKTNYSRIRIAGSGASTIIDDFEAEIVDTIGNNPLWNEFTGSIWQQNFMAAGTYMNVWLLALPTCADARSQEHRYLWMTGQENPATLQDALDVSPREITYANIAEFEQFTVISRIVVFYSGSDWTIEASETIEASTQQLLTKPFGNYLTYAKTDDETILGTGTATDPLVSTGAVLANVSVQGSQAEVSKLSLELVSDWDFSEVGTGDWTPINSALLTKEANQELGQVLRVAENGQPDPTATQDIGLLSDQRTEVKVRARSDGSMVPKIYLDGVLAWTGTTDTDYQLAIVESTTAVSSGNIQLVAEGLSGYCEFDIVSCKVKRVVDNTSQKIVAVSRQNLLVYPNQFDQAGWSVANSYLMIDTGQITSSSNNMSGIIGTPINTNHNIMQTVTLTDEIHTLQVQVKKGAVDYVYLFTNAPNTPYAYFNLSNGSVGTVNNAISANIISNGKDGYLISMEFVAANDPTGIVIGSAEIDDDITFLGDGLSISTFVGDSHLYKGAIADIIDYADGGASQFDNQLKWEIKDDEVRLLGNGLLRVENSTKDGFDWKLPVENDGIEYILEIDYKGVLYCKHYNQQINSPTHLIDTIPGLKALFIDRLDIVTDCVPSGCEIYPVNSRGPTTGDFVRIKAEQNGDINMDVGNQLDNGDSYLVGRMVYRK